MDRMEFKDEFDQNSSKLWRIWNKQNFYTQFFLNFDIIMFDTKHFIYDYHPVQSKIEKWLIF